MKTDLECRLAALNAEIRHYPTPIARCDEQLSALLEQRAQLAAQKRAPAHAGGCTPLNSWLNDGGSDVA